MSALDVSVQSQVLNLLKDLQQKYGLTYLFIGHDLSVINFIADRICVMFLGNGRGEHRKMLMGEIPSPVNPPSGCCFRTRCPYATERCAKEKPQLKKVDGRYVACHHVEEQFPA